MTLDLSFPRVLQVLPSLISGGVENASADMVAGIKKAYPNAETFVASSGGVLVDKIFLLGGKHFELSLKDKAPWALVRNAFSLKSLIKKNNIQIIHARSRAPAWSSFWAARQTKIPFITTYHGIYNSNSSVKSFYNSIMARGDRVIAISEYVAEHIKQHYPNLTSHIVVIPEGIDTAYFDPAEISVEAIDALRAKWAIPPESKIILLPGRLTKWKGQKVLIEALRQMDTTSLFGIILGDSQGRETYYQELMNQAKDLPIKFINDYHDMPTAYALADVVLSCSTDPEAFGRVTAEALAMGRPYIGTNHGATPEMCLHGKTGFLVPPGSVETLAAMIHYVLSLPNEKGEALSVNARQHIFQNFSLDQMVNRTLSLYKAVA
ncbi:MAG: glycosyltransferase family 4 protein [Alphaproteobacteria bacterium]|nr:glycosyltransferase family 4 protein [Alphaproteobacteria bacterium]